MLNYQYNNTKILVKKTKVVCKNQLCLYLYKITVNLYEEYMELHEYNNVRVPSYLIINCTSSILRTGIVH